MMASPESVSALRQELLLLRDGTPDETQHRSAKIAALAVLFVASWWHATVWLLAECVVLLGLRMAARDWRGWTQGVDSLFPSLLFHVFDWKMFREVETNTGSTRRLQYVAWRGSPWFSRDARSPL